MEATATRAPIKVGVIADQTGPLSFMGIANANVAKMVIDDINAAGGLLGQQIELHLEDSETDDSCRGSQRRQARPAGSGRCDLRWHLQLDAAGHQGSRPSWMARRSTSTPSSTRDRSATRSSSAPARCRRSRSTRSFPG